MALLMLGVFRPENDRDGRGDRLARDRRAGRWRRGSSLEQPAGTADAVRRRLRGRRLRPLHEGADARRLAPARCCCRSTTCARRKLAEVRVPGAGAAGDRRHDDDVSANDLIALYLGLELQSLALYVLAAFRRDDVRSSEAGLKYFVLGALSSGMLLYGASLIYGFTGSTSFAAIAAARQGRRRRPGHRPDLRPGVPAGRPRLQDLGRAVPHVDARRLRGRADAGHGLLRRRAQGRGDGAADARDARRLRRHRPAVAAGRDVRSPSPRWCSAPSPPSARPTSSGCWPTRPSATSAMR